MSSRRKQSRPVGLVDPLQPALTDDDASSNSSATSSNTTTTATTTTSADNETLVEQTNATVIEELEDTTAKTDRQTLASPVADKIELATQEVNLTEKS
jgi:hypothetical protein